jgi:hypothetical protein
MSCGLNVFHDVGVRLRSSSENFGVPFVDKHRTEAFGSAFRRNSKTDFWLTSLSGLCPALMSDYRK